jgi:hypothetical protein
MENMKPDEETFREFKEECEKEFGRKLSNEEASEAFSRLINVLRIVYYYGSTIPSLDRREPDRNDS